MPAKIICPHCGKELKVQQRLAGRKVVCPKCQGGFRVEAQVAGGEADEHVADSKIHRVTPPPVPADSQAHLDEDLEAMVAGVLTASPHESAGAVRGVEPPPVQMPIPKPRAAAQTRRPSRAKLIEADPAETKVQLNAQGELPHLRLRDDPKKPLEESKEAKSNPLLLVGVVCFSIVVSVILLFVEPGAGVGENQLKTQAREEIRQHYWGSPSANQPLLPYQKLLREAIQANHRGDGETERARYRDVLKLLRADNQTALGLTGVKSHGSPPNDRHLEELLATLLRYE